MSYLQKPSKWWHCTQIGQNLYTRVPYSGISMGVNFCYFRGSPRCHKIFHPWIFTTFLHACAQIWTGDVMALFRYLRLIDSVLDTQGPLSQAVPSVIAFSKPDLTNSSADSFSILKAIHTGVGWVWLATLASHARLIHLLPRSKFTLCHSWSYCATKFKNHEFNSGVLFQLFTKISTHENNPLYSMHILYHKHKQFSVFTTSVSLTCAHSNYCSLNL